MITPSDLLHASILVADDKVANVLLLEQMLRAAGYQNVTSTLRSEDVCELHLEHSYDLILLDLEMPGMDGFQVMENLREIEVDGYLPVLVITVEPGHKLRALRAGARDFVSKPFDLAEVLVRVQNLLEVRLLHRETRRLYERVIAEQRVSERLLAEGLPQSVIDRLRERPLRAAEAGDGAIEVVAEGCAELTVLFADIVEFTRFCEGVSAAVLGGVLNEVSARLDNGRELSVVDGATLIGDAYLAALGLADAQTERAIRASKRALELVRAIDRYNDQSHHKLRVRIGLDTVRTVAGVVHKRRLDFDL